MNDILDVEDIEIIEEEDLDAIIANDAESDEDAAEVISDEDAMTLSSDNSSFSLSLRVEDIDDPREFSKFIKNVERTIRCSPEYRMWVAYLKDVLGVVNCEVTNENNEDVTIEIHHHPLNLYMIVYSEIKKMIGSGNKFCSFDIATKVIELHFKNKVGYIPLISTLHEKFHNGKFHIPMELVKGDYKYLLEQNVDFLDESDKDLVKARLAVNKTNCGWSVKWIKNNNGN